MVAVICLCYNHSEYLEETLNSVLAQTMPPAELWIVDDASTDGSAIKIEQWIHKNKEILPFPIFFIKNEENKGNCKSFNLAFEQIKSPFVIDLAADDCLAEHRIALQYEVFSKLPPTTAVVFSNAWLIDAQSRIFATHFPIDKAGKATTSVPSGWIYDEVLRHYFICTPTMMMRTEVLRALDGYDETLSYEDFDFWVRTTPFYTYHYIDECTTFKRILPHSHAQGFYTPYQNAHLRSTHRICLKIANQYMAFTNTVLFANLLAYYVRQSVYMQDYATGKLFYALYTQISPKKSLSMRFLGLLLKWKLPLYPFYKKYLWLRKKMLNAFALR